MNTHKIPIVVLRGIPDNGVIYATMSSDQQNVRSVFNGTSSFLPYLSPERFTISSIFLSNKPSQTLNLPIEGVLVNYLSDPDLYNIALSKANELVSQTHRACFNDPQHIFKTRRDQLEKTLQNIAGLYTPRTIRFSPQHPNDFIQAIRQNQLRYPIILRLAGDQGGISTVRLDCAEDLDRIYALPWGGRAVYASEWHEYRDSDEFYRKYRIIMIGGEPVLRHVIIGEQWLLHSSKRIATPQAKQEESHCLKNFDQTILPNISNTLLAIYQRVGLDFFGIDCHLAKDGTMTIFEVNATMNALYNHQPSPNPWDAPCASILTKLVSVLEKYRCSVMAKNAKK
jgi:glutathione synthase/RimK-type ligase-like ATP-grasp enzyme